MASNFQSIADWQPPETLPNDTVGEYLVLVRNSRTRRTNLETYKILQIQNGVMRMVGSHFAWDVLGRDSSIVAWAPAPAHPEWLED